MQQPKTIFVALLGSAEFEPRVRFAIASLREFGGPLALCPVLVFAPAALSGSAIRRLEGVETVALELES